MTKHTNKKEIESFNISHFSDYKYFIQLMAEELEKLFSITECDHENDPHTMNEMLIEQGYKVNYFNN